MRFFVNNPWLFVNKARLFLNKSHLFSEKWLLLTDKRSNFSEKYSVSPLCQRVSPFETLHALYLLGLYQCVTLFLKM
jgi:hypothetical protein